MERVLLALAVVAVAVVVAQVVRRRRSDPPTQPAHVAPTQLDRADFGGAGWLVAVFTSDSCSTCADVVRKAEVLGCADVTVDVVTFQAQRELHERYLIDAVPLLVVADADGVVHGAYVGPVTATDLWATVANARHPGSIRATTRCDHSETS